jgi:hypothetical protein
MVDSLGMSVGRSTGDQRALVFAIATPANGGFACRISRIPRVAARDGSRINLAPQTLPGRPRVGGSIASLGNLYGVRHRHGFKLDVVVAIHAAALIVAFEARC